MHSLLLAAAGLRSAASEEQCMLAGEQIPPNKRGGEE